jgi:DtxR family transcriptional regulator, Mn-dependent transcriptional regulator
MSTASQGSGAAGGFGWQAREEGRSDSNLREELLELLWTLREGDRCRVEDVLKETGDGEGEELLRAMERDGWISMEQGKVLFTEEGERRAAEVIRRHRLAERLLSEVFELEESSVESSACQFEHILSPRVLDSVCTFLGHPPTCPHGKPIPRGPCCAKFKREVEPLVLPLPDLKLGEEGRVVFIKPRSRSRLERLSSMGLIPGSTVKLIQRRPSFVLEIGETALALDEEIVREIYVKRI